MFHNPGDLSLSLYMSLSVCHSLSLCFLSWSLCFSKCVSLLSLFVCLSLHLYLSVSFWLFLSYSDFPVCLFVSLSLSLSQRTPVYVYITSLRVSVCLSASDSLSLIPSVDQPMRRNRRVSTMSVCWVQFLLVFCSFQSSAVFQMNPAHLPKTWLENTIWSMATKLPKTTADEQKLVFGTLTPADATRAN